MFSKPTIEQPRRRAGVIVAIVLAAVALYFVFVNKSQSPVPTTPLGAGQPRFAPAGAGASQSTPAGFPPFDPSAVNAARRQLTQQTYGLVETSGHIEVSYPQGWVPQSGPNGVSVMHPDGLALFEYGFFSAAANTSADAIFESKILPEFRRTAQDVRVLGAVPQSLAEGLLVGKEYYATAMYQGRRVFGGIMILKVSNVGLTAIPGVGYLPETFKFVRISGPAERFPMLYAMASAVREIPADNIESRRRTDQGMIDTLGGVYRYKDPDDPSYEGTIPSSKIPYGPTRWWRCGNQPPVASNGSPGYGCREVPAPY